jgi:DNA repair exonuclease SbcCD ATPase subunit
MKKGLAIFILAMLMLPTSARRIPSFGLFAYSDPDVDTESSCEIAADLLALVENSSDKAEALVNSLEEEGSEVPGGAVKALEKGDEFYEAALAHMNMSECELASEKLTEALQHYGKASQIALEVEVDPEVLLATEEAEDEYNLRVEIERAFLFLEKVNETASDFEEESVDVTEVRSLLLEANQTLTSAVTELESGNIAGGEALKSEARGMIGQAMGLLNSMNHVNKAERAAKFLEKAQERLQRMQGKLNGMLSNLDLPQQAMQGINRALENAQKKMQAVMGLLDSGDLDGALDEFGEVQEESDEALEIVDEHDHGLGKKLDSIAKLGSKIEFYTEKILELEAMGEDMSDIKALLDLASGKLTEASDILDATDLDEDQIDAVEELIDKAEEHIEEFDDLFDELKEMIDEREEEEEEREEQEKDADEEPEVETEEEGEEAEVAEKIEELEEKLSTFEEEVEELKNKQVNVGQLTGQINRLRELIKAAKGSENPEKIIENAEGVIEEIEDLLDILG